MKKSISDYRVVEKKEGFTVQIKTTITNTEGLLWYKKTETKDTWNILDKNGYVCFVCLTIAPTKPKVYESLQDAKEAIESFVKYPIFHYFKSNLEPPKMPDDRVG